MAEREIMVSSETIRRWADHFPPMVAVNLRKRRREHDGTWHLDWLPLLDLSVDHASTSLGSRARIHSGM